MNLGSESREILNLYKVLTPNIFMGIKHSKEWTNQKGLELLNMKDSERLALISKMIDSVESPREKTAIALSYIYGARPQEFLMLKKEEFKIIGDDLRVKLPTVKKGNPRIIELDIKETPFLQSIVVPYLDTILDDEPIFRNWKDPTNINQVFKKAMHKVGFEFNPNVFRHFRMSYIGYLGGNMMQLKAWKGAKTQQSVEEYLGFKPVTEFKKAIR